jgi:S-formylglutathione hydrolase FrmB
MNPLNWSLLDGALPAILLAAGFLALAVLAVGGTLPGRWWRIWLPVIVVLAAGLAVLAGWLINDVWHPFADLLPVSVMAWAGVALAGIALAAARQPLLHTWPRRIGAIVAGIVVLAAAGNEINQVYQQYPTLRVALGPWLDKKPAFHADNQGIKLITAPKGKTLASVWHPPANMPKTGQVYTIDIPGKVSKFQARGGYLYLPPAYLSDPRPELPVLVLLAGQPGAPRQWVDSGGIQQMIDAFAAQHQGLAPVVVMPDDLGSDFANPLCLDSKLGNVQTYLTTDVPDWITANLAVRPPGAGWAIAGFSHGGTCSIQLTTQAPKVYPVFIDISGQEEPTLGSREKTVQKAFGGDAAAFAKVNPKDVMAHTKFPENKGIFVGGADDHTYTPQQRALYEEARAAGMDVTLEILPGGHSWQVWKAGLQNNVSWLAAQLGIT